MLAAARRAIRGVFGALLCVGAAHAQFSKPGVPQQIKLGQEVAEQIRQKEKVLPVDDPHVAMLRKVATRVLSNIHDNESWAFSFDVIDSPIMNAFSLPGGPTFFYTGLMDKLKNEDELAGVLAHELTHVRLQHWATQYAASQRRGLLISLGLILSKANYEASELAGLTNDLVFNLPFSRSEESQADAGGFELVVQAGYNPNGMVSVFQMFAKTLNSKDNLSFLSDHPTDATRIRKLQDLISGSSSHFPDFTPVSY